MISTQEISLGWVDKRPKEAFVDGKRKRGGDKRPEKKTENRQGQRNMEPDRSVFLSGFKAPDLLIQPKHRRGKTEDYNKHTVVNNQ